MSQNQKMIWTYNGWSEEKCCEWFVRENDRELNLFESYIETNLERENTKKDKYSKKVRPWLSWLAKTMVSESKTIFLIEKLQPTHLSSICEKISYPFVNCLFIAFSLGFIYLLIFFFTIFGITFELVSSLQKGFFLALYFGFYTGAISSMLTSKITTFEQLSWNWRLSLEKTKPIIIIALIGALISALIYRLSQQVILVELISIILGWIFGIPIYFFFNALNNSELWGKKEPNQGIWLSLKNARRLGSIGILVASIFISSKYSNVNHFQYRNSTTKRIY